MSAPTLTDTELVRTLCYVHRVPRATIATRTGYGERTVSRWLAGRATIRPAVRAVLEQMLAEATPWWEGRAARG